MSNPNQFRVGLRLQDAWKSWLREINSIRNDSIVKPEDPQAIFIADDTADNDEVKFDISPVVMRLPERANNKDGNLYVVIKGWISFTGPDFKTLPLKTKSFGTEVAYFRVKKEVVEHVMGVHYDLDEQILGHPVFHAQIGSNVQAIDIVNERFNTQFPACDRMESVLKNVRMPSAQMDFFSVLIQICADHLIQAPISKRSAKAFKKMNADSGFLIGSAHRMAFLQGPASTCYRSSHWYKAAE